jgi:fluoroquinolone transport system ATP-binding protein
VIEVRELRFTYPGAERPAVDGLDFQVAAGEIFGFLGPSGAGKSTTQNVLIRLLRGYGGSARVLGREVAQWTQDYFERVGVSFELPSHFLKLTARENLAYFRALYRGPTRTVEDALEAVGLGEHADKRVQAFSKGMKVRLNLARSLLHDPEVLFLDEPTSGLDPANAARVRDLVRTHRDRGATVFLTTHDMHVAGALCDRVAFLVDGRIRELDAPRELKLRYGRKEVTVGYRATGAVAERSFALDGLGRDEAFLHLLRTEEVESIHSQESTLEDVFLRVTGRRLS